MSDGDKKDDFKLLSFEKKDIDKQKAALTVMKRDLPFILESILLLAKIRKANYDAHIKEGFTEEQALELCKNIGFL